MAVGFCGHSKKIFRFLTSWLIYDPVIIGFSKTTVFPEVRLLTLWLKKYLRTDAVWSASVGQ